MDAAAQQQQQQMEQTLYLFLWRKPQRFYNVQVIWAHWGGERGTGLMTANSKWKHEVTLQVVSVKDAKPHHDRMSLMQIRSNLITVSFKYRAESPLKQVLSRSYSYLQRSVMSSEGILFCYYTP